MNKITKFKKNLPARLQSSITTVKSSSTFEFKTRTLCIARSKSAKVTSLTFYVVASKTIDYIDNGLQIILSADDRAIFMLDTIAANAFAR